MRRVSKYIERFEYREGSCKLREFNYYWFKFHAQLWDGISIANCKILDLGTVRRYFIIIIVVIYSWTRMSRGNGCRIRIKDTKFERRKQVFSSDKYEILSKILETMILWGKVNWASDVITYGWFGAVDKYWPYCRIIYLNILELNMIAHFVFVGF